MGLLEPRHPLRIQHAAGSFAIGQLNQVSTTTAIPSNAQTNAGPIVPSVTSSYSYGSFDALGRSHTSTQTTGGTPYGFQYSYNLAGSLLTETYPSGRQVAYSYDNLNRPISLANYVSHIAYWPHGAIYSYMRQNGLGYGATYNSRLQPTEIAEATRVNSNDTVGSPNNLLFAACLNWGLGGVSGPYGVCPSLSTVSNHNGNLQSVTVPSPSDNITPGTFANLTGIQQSFGYDSVNRIS